MTPFPEQPTLPQLQRYMTAICQERGWTQDNDAEKFLLFTEEIGELAKAIRKTRGLYQEQERQNTLNLEEEFAHVLSHLLDLANAFGVDLEAAFRAKEAVNATRTWG